MRQTTVPLPHIHLVITKPVKCTVTMLDSVLKRTNISITISLQLVPNATTLTVVVHSLKDRAIA